MRLPKAIEEMAASFEEIKASPDISGQSTNTIFIEEIFRKHLILSSASHFEFRISNAIESHAKTIASSDGCVFALVKHKALKRQYHTFFDWDNLKLGTFTTLMGDSLGLKLKEAYKEEQGRLEVDAFLEIGQLRNRLVHNNFVSFQCEKTSCEILELCNKAESFVVRVETLLGQPVQANEPE
jgi:hypothetical protein